jgi:AcrR family transcriptional regulator
MDPHRSAIIEATVDAYVDDPTNVTPEAVCERLGVSRGVFDSHFISVNDVIRAWYPNAVDIVSRQTQEIPDFGSLPLQDRLGTFCFMLIDVVESRLPFVTATFRYQASPFGSSFQRRLREALQTILQAPNVPGVNYLVVDSDVTRFVVAESIVQMIQSWLHDESPDRARATALIDRILALLSEIMINRVPEKAADLIKYAVEAGYLPVDRLPLIGDMFKSQDTDE